MLQFGASLTDDTRSINYDRNTFIIQATGDKNRGIIYLSSTVSRRLLSSANRWGSFQFKSDRASHLKERMQIIMTRSWVLTVKLWMLSSIFSVRWMVWLMEAWQLRARWRRTTSRCWRENFLKQQEFNDKTGALFICLSQCPGNFWVEQIAGVVSNSYRPGIHTLKKGCR